VNRPLLRETGKAHNLLHIRMEEEAMAKSIAQRLSALEKLMAKILKPENLITTRRKSKKKKAAKKKAAPKAKPRKRKARKRPARTIFPAPPILL